MTDQSPTRNSPDWGVIVGSAVGYLAFAAGLFMWAIGVPITAVEQIQGIAIPAEAGLLTVALMVYGVVSGIGWFIVRASLGGRHLATRITLWVYLALLAVGLVVITVVNSS